jgi:hypothetical protein
MVMTRDELEARVRTLIEEAWTIDPEHVEDLIVAITGAKIFVYGNLTTAQLQAFRAPLLTVCLSGRGAPFGPL